MERNTKRIKQPWPTKEVMEQVYENKLWGGQNSDFYSGEGSHLSEFVNPYVETVASFLASFEHQLVVCDLGCGDFNVGKELVTQAKKYVAVDIVTDLIERNKKVFKIEHVEFHCLDISKDDLPFGDCALVRQVLQHLSNAEVERILEKLDEFKYVILTEHLPAGDFEPNKDIISGQGTRLKKQSGLNLLAPPFNWRVKEQMVLLSLPLNDGKSAIVTTLYSL